MTATVFNFGWNLELDGGDPDDFTWEDVETHGVEIGKLREGEWFAFVGAKSYDGPSGMAQWTGTVVHKSQCSVLVQLDRGFSSRGYWAPETKVIRLPHPNEGKRITLTQFTEE